jgi:hypothetical protein
MKDLFGDEIKAEEAIHVNIYADEIWNVENIRTKEVWMYSIAIYERVDKPILSDLINTRYCKDKEGWEEKFTQNDTDIHWAELRGDLSKKFIIERWLEYIYNDCFSERKFYMSFAGINLTNLNRTEFDSNQNLNSIYNRFFRSMIQYSLKKFFDKGVVVDNIFHEQGSQENHDLFDWHTIFKLDQDEHLNFNCRNIVFLPKSHRDNERSNLLQLCDVLAGILKDLHCGISKSKNSKNRETILNSKYVQELFVKRVIRKPLNRNSSYGYSNRFNLSFFPKTSSKKDSLNRLMGNYYDLSKIELTFENNIFQPSLF